MTDEFGARELETSIILRHIGEMSIIPESISVNGYFSTVNGSVWRLVHNSTDLGEETGDL